MRSSVTLLPSAVYISAMPRTNHTNLMSTGGALFRFSSSASVPTQQQDQDQKAWSYKGTSKKQVAGQINFLLNTLRDMVGKIAELESDKMELLKKPDKSENDMLV